jgi:hypothetical protein
MQKVPKKVVKALSRALLFYPGHFFRSYGMSKARLMLVLGLLVVSPFYGCATGQVIVSSYEDDNSNCTGLDKDLGLTQVRLQKLEATDTTKRDIGNFAMGLAGFIIPPLGLFNVVFFFTDSYVADYTEKKALKNRYNNMVRVSQRQECGSKYALIPNKEDNAEPNA